MEVYLLWSLSWNLLWWKCTCYRALDHNLYSIRDVRLPKICQLSAMNSHSEAGSRFSSSGVMSSLYVPFFPLGGSQIHWAEC